jgi:hypothetical protein
MFNKGRGVSRMISDFIVAHPDMTCFELTEDEWDEAIKENPALNNPLYLRKTAKIIIEPTKDNYFTNDLKLNQFQHLILCLKYSKIFKNCNYRDDILVYNATTHTKAFADVSMFNKSVNTHCGIDKLVWKDANDNECSLVCFYQSGPNAGKSKGLFNLCKELIIIEENTLWKAIKLTDLRILASF